MKLTLRPEALRVRVDEAELARLLAGECLRVACHHGEQPLLALAVTLAATTTLAPAAGGWQLQLDRGAVTQYGTGLPRRDALELPLDGGPALEFDVDVRDSVRVRRRREASAGAGDGQAARP